MMFDGCSVCTTVRGVGGGKSNVNKLDMNKKCVTAVNDADMTRTLRLSRRRLSVHI